jgi:hypothetical protein
MAIGKAFFQFLQELVVAVGADLVFLKFKDKVATDIGTSAGSLVGRELNDLRAELLEDFRIIQQADKKNAENLFRRHQEAKDSQVPTAENRFIKLLCKTCKDPSEGRRPTLIWLNGLSDQRFDQALAILEHDVFLQWFERFRRYGKKVIADNWQDLKLSSGILLHGFNQGTSDLADQLEAWANERNAKRKRTWRTLWL